MGSYVARHLDVDVMLMHDPDTFMIEPYRCYDTDTNQLNMMTLLNTTQGSYEGVFQSIMGIERTTPNCFVTELVPVRKSDFVALQKHLANRWPTKHWLDAIIDAVPGMPTVPPWGTGNIIKWFSEYEFLGNWAVHCGNVVYQEQRRFEYNSLEKIDQFNSQHNAICDAVPDLQWSMQMNWDTLEIPGFDQYQSRVLARIDELTSLQSW